jgi:hypothetical protein
MRTETMLTTTDNPYSPFDDFDAWRAYDLRLGYNSESLLDRIAVTSDQLSEHDYNLAIEQAIDAIIKENISGVHTKVTRQVKD